MQLGMQSRSPQPCPLPFRRLLGAVSLLSHSPCCFRSRILVHTPKWSDRYAPGWPCTSLQPMSSISKAFSVPSTT